MLSQSFGRKADTRIERANTKALDWRGDDGLIKRTFDARMEALTVAAYHRGREVD